MLLAALAVVVAAEAGARVAAPLLPDPHLYGDSTTAAKVLQLDRLEGCTDLVVAGNSMARDAFDPGVLDGATGYNAALDAASPALLDRWLTEEVLPRTHPAVVLVAVASLDLNTNSRAGAAARQAYDDAPATAGGFLGRLGALATRSSALVAHRRELTDPAQWGPALDHLRAGTRPSHLGPEGIEGLIGPQGQGLADQDLTYEPPPGPVLRRFVTEQLLNDFRIGDESVAALRRLVRDLRAQGTTVVLAALPVTADYVALHPGGAADFDAYRRTLASVAADEGLPLIDLHADAPVAEFADTHHLNRAGSVRFTRSLPDRLRAAGAPLRSCRG